MGSLSKHVLVGVGDVVGDFGMNLSRIYLRLVDIYREASRVQSLDLRLLLLHSLSRHGVLLLSSRSCLIHLGAPSFLHLS